MLAAALRSRRDLADLLREVPALVRLAIVPEVALRSGERALVAMRRLERAIERLAAHARDARPLERVAGRGGEDGLVPRARQERDARVEALLARLDGVREVAHLERHAEHAGVATLDEQRRRARVAEVEDERHRDGLRRLDAREADLREERSERLEERGELEERLVDAGALEAPHELARLGVIEELRDLGLVERAEGAAFVVAPRRGGARCEPLCSSVSTAMTARTPPPPVSARKTCTANGQESW